MSREHAYAYESGYKSGYRDGSINYELEHCPACKNIADLQEALAENAKLRELVRDMYKCLEHCKLVCEYCKFQGVDCQWFKFADRMRELGIEVDDGVS